MCMTRESGSRWASTDVRVKEAGLDSVKVQIPHSRRYLNDNPLWVAGLGALVSVAVVGLAASGEFSYDGELQVDEAAVATGFFGAGAVGAWWGIRKFRKKPYLEENWTTSATEFRMRSSIEATFVPTKGDAWVTHGDSDLRVAQ